MTCIISWVCTALENPKLHLEKRKEKLDNSKAFVWVMKTDECKR